MRRLPSALVLGLFLLTPGVALADEVPEPEPEPEKKDEDKKDGDTKDGDEKDGDEKDEKSGCSVADPSNGAIGTIAMGIAILGGFGLSRRRHDQA